MTTKVLFAALLPLGTAHAGNIWSNTAPGYGIQTLGCNNVATHQIPGYPDYFASRLGITVDSDGNREPTPGSMTCDYTSERLILTTMNWDTKELEYVTTLLDSNCDDDDYPMTPIQDGRFVLGSAYDPTVVEFAGELWVSFECAGHHMGGTSACMGPMGAPGDDSTIDLSRTTIIVEGHQCDQGCNEISATVPKIFTHGDSLFVFYDVFLTGDTGSIGQRGVEVEICDGRAFVKGAGCDTYDVTDPSGLAREVWARNPDDDTMNNLVDVFSVTSDGNFIWATAGIGGCDGGCCDAPTNDQGQNGCYRSAMARSNFPLGPFDWVINTINASALPSNSMEYLKVLVNPTNNETSLYLQALDERPQGPGYDMPSGFQAIPVPTGGGNAGFFGLAGSPCGGDQPSPDWGERAGACQPSCGGLSGQGFDTSCYDNGRSDVGTAYDTPYW